MYTLSTLLPLLPVKQRFSDPADWISTDADIACPDPNCKALFRITRTKTEEIPVIEENYTPPAENNSEPLPSNSEEINVKDIPF